MNWTRDLAYIVGLFASDGCLYNDGRHMSFVSKDLEQVENFKRILNLTNKIGLKSSGRVTDTLYYNLQFGGKELYNFFLDIGLTQRKSLTMGELSIPNRFFGDFLRGCLDGDGFTLSYWSKQWPKSFVFYFGISSGSIKYLEWLQSKIKELYEAEGVIAKGTRGFNLKYGKYNSYLILNEMYHSKNVTCLSRKWFKIDQALGIIRSQQAGVSER